MSASPKVVHDAAKYKSDAVTRIRTREKVENLYTSPVMGSDRLRV